MINYATFNRTPNIYRNNYSDSKGSKEYSDTEYNLEDEDELEYNDEDNDEIEEEDEGRDPDDPDNDLNKEVKIRRPKPIRLMIDMMLNPINGWKKIRRSNMKYEEVASRCFLPLIGIGSLSCFLKCIYDTSLSISIALISAVKIFVALYLGNFLALLMIKLLMPKNYKDIANSNFGKQFVMFLISTLAIFYALYQCLPMLGPALTFLPLWTIYLAIRGCKFFHFDSEKGNLLVTLICLAIIFGPLCVYWLLDNIL